MANKFQGIEPAEPGTDLVKPAQMGMDGGFRGDVSPRSILPGETPVLDDVRFERTAIRKDFGWQAIGAAATTAIRGLIEHKFISEGLEFARLVRVTVDATDFAIIEIWDGNNWVFVDTSDPITVNDVYFSILSAQGALYMSEGSQILCWLEDFATVSNENDFPQGTQNLVFEGDSSIVIVTPGFPAGLLQYSIGYNVAFNRTVVEVGEGDVVVIQFTHEGTPLGTAVHSADRFESFPFNTGDQAFIFNATILDLDEVQAEIIQIRTGNIVAADDVTNAVSAGDPLFGGPGPPFQAAKSLIEPARNDRYTWSNFVVNFDDDPCTVTIEYSVDFGDGVWVLQATVVWTRPGTVGAGPLDLIIPGLAGPNQRFGMELTGSSGANCAPSFIDFGRVRWDALVTDVRVHCNNKALSGDPTAGITYETSGVAQSTFEPINPGPGARYLVHFARRLIALQDLGDRQVFSFSADGILTDYDGVGSGKLFLVDTRSDGIDALQGGAVLNSNFLAVFRQRSIMRAFETGNIQQAVGVVTWIENLGTNFPFSIRNVVGGVMFLGHDSMVYFLTEQGAVGVGLPIHQEIIEDLTGDLSLVDSGYDPTFGEYYLGYPVGAATEITKVWVFDVDRWNEKRETIWRRKPMDVQRFATAGISEVL